MTYEMLEKIREEVKEKQKSIKIHNKNVDRVNKLLTYKCIIEYFTLVDEEPFTLKYMDNDIENIIDDVFRENIYQIKNNETNKIYVYKGTYKYDDSYDIVHGASSIRVNRNDPTALFSVYQDIEQNWDKNVRIDKCDDFEKDNYVIFGKISNYYQIRKEFIVDAVNLGQEKAVSNVLKKYIKKK